MKNLFLRVTRRWLEHPRVRLIFGLMGVLGALYLVARVLHPRVNELGVKFFGIRL